MIKRILSHLRSSFFLWNLLILTVLAILAGAVIVTHGRHEKFSVLLKISGLIPSILYSGIIALILTLVIYVVSFIANAKYAGKGMNSKWLRFQFLYGVILTLLIELVAATILFALMGHWILNTAFFDKIFLPVALFVMLVNLGYLLFYIQRIRVEVQTVRYQAISLQLDNDQEGINEYRKNGEPALFYIRNGEVWKKSFDGKQEYWSKSLGKTMDKLDPQQYFKCARNWIVHRNAISSICMLKGRRIGVQCWFNVPIALEVSRRNAQEFKDWLYRD